jgi:predicted RNA binding protein YcfA (HicA-like mRNA interferase family)
MNVPKGVSADRLIRALQRLGYRVIRQKGSHIRLKHDGPPGHSITVPRHDSLKTGTLQGIISEVSERRGLPENYFAENL